jgi:hypothetical protein
LDGKGYASRRYTFSIPSKDGYESDIEPSGALLGKGDSGFFDTMAEPCRCGYRVRLVSENFYDHGPVGKLNDDPKALMLKDYKVLKEIAR